MSELNWTDAQWQKVNDRITEAFGKASIASAVVPCYGPLAASAEYVRDETLNFPAGANTVAVTDDTTLRLFNLRVFVRLSSEQVADESLASAMLAFRRAATTLALVEDDIVFNGVGNQRANAQGVAPGVPNFGNQNVVASGPASFAGLIRAGLGGTAQQIQNNINARPVGAQPDAIGRNLVPNVSTAIGNLEGEFQTGPFVCILGHELFDAAHTPTQGLVLPAERITALLKGPLLRSSRMGAPHGIVLSQTSSDIDLVVATPPKAQFLQIDNQARYVFRVYEKFILRVKDPEAVCGVAA